MTVWNQANRYQIPRILFVNKLDRPGADFDNAVIKVRKRLKGNGVPVILSIPVFYPITAGLKPTLADHGLCGTIDLISMTYVRYEEETVICTSLTPEHQYFYHLACKHRSLMLDTLADLDDDILSSLPDPEPQQLHLAIRRLTLSNQITPILAGGALKNIGVQPLLDAVNLYLPSPEDRPSITNTPLDPSGKLVALAFKLQHNTRREPMTFLRIYSGTMKNRCTAHNVTQNLPEKHVTLFRISGDVLEPLKELQAGDIGIAMNTRSTQTGDTLTSSNKHNVHLPGITIPDAAFYASFTPTTSDAGRMLPEVLAKLELEDPSFRSMTDSETGQIVVHGMGELHFEIIRSRLKDWGVDTKLGSVRIAYREAGEGNQKKRFNWDKQILGQSSKASCSLDVYFSPQPIQTSTSPRRSIIPEAMHTVLTNGNLIHIQKSDLPASGLASEYIESIVKGINISLSRGPILHYVTSGVEIYVEDIAVGPENNPGAYQACLLHGLNEICKTHVNLLMEPFMMVHVSCQAKDVGPVTSDIVIRRGEVMDVEFEEETEDAEIQCVMPLASIGDWTPTLRSISGGRASFKLEPFEYRAITGEEKDRVFIESRGYA